MGSVYGLSVFLRLKGGIKLSQNIFERLLSRKEAAELLGTTEGTLAVWSCTKRYGLPFVKIGRLVKYKLSDLEDFIQRRTQSGGNEL